jgi:hypothetical protein
MRPAQQRFGAGQRTGGQVDLGLEHQAQLAGLLERGAEIVDQREAAPVDGILGR